LLRTVLLLDVWTGPCQQRHRVSRRDRACRWIEYRTESTPPAAFWRLRRCLHDCRSIRSDGHPNVVAVRPIPTGPLRLAPRRTVSWCLRGGRNRGLESLWHAGIDRERGSRRRDTGL